MSTVLGDPLPPIAVVDRDTSEKYPAVMVTPNTVAVTGHGDLRNANVYIGRPYRWVWQPITLYIRDQQGIPETSGRLQLRRLDAFYKDTTDLTLTVTPKGRTPIEYKVNLPTPSGDRLNVPILAQNEQTELLFTDDTCGATALTEIDWEAFFTTRSRRF